MMAGPSMVSAGPSNGSPLSRLCRFGGSCRHIWKNDTSGMCIHHFMINAIQMDPEFNNGNYAVGTPKLALHLIQQVARIYYTHESFIKKQFWDSVPEGKNSQEKRSLNAKAYLMTGVEQRIEGRDPNCYIRILNAINSYDLGRDVQDYKKGVQRLKCPVLLINISTDSEFPPYWAEEVAKIRK